MPGPVGAPYLMLMPKKRYWRTAADLAKARRRRQIEAGEIRGLFEKGAKQLRPEIRALIEAAVAKKKVDG